MEKPEFAKYVELIMSMSMDYLTKRNHLSQDTYISNLKIMVEQMEKLSDGKHRVEENGYGNA